MSNEHLDMSGNWADLPFYCDQCGQEVQEHKAYGIPSHPASRDDELMFCSNECANQYLDLRRPG